MKYKTILDIERDIEILEQATPVNLEGVVYSLLDVIKYLKSIGASTSDVNKNVYVKEFIKHINYMIGESFCKHD